MKPFAIITPTRGDRPELLNFLRSRIPTEYEHIVVDYKPKDNSMDLVPRIKSGIDLAKFKGYEYVMIAEDDDYYDKDFFDNIDFDGADFYGFSETTYYNIKNRTHQTFKHTDRSSLFCTGFKISALESFIWPPDHWKFLDIRIWEYANSNDFDIKLMPENTAVGIKHGIGVCAGKGHQMTNKYKDSELRYLKSIVDDEAFLFYQKIMEVL